MVRNNIMIQEYTEVQALEFEPLGLPSISLPNNFTPALLWAGVCAVTVKF